MNSITNDTNFTNTKKVILTLSGKTFATSGNTPGEDGSVVPGDGTDFIDLRDWVECCITAQGYGGDITGINIQCSMTADDDEKSILLPLSGYVNLGTNPPPYIRFHYLTGSTTFTFLRIYIWGKKRVTGPYEITDLPIRVV